MSLVHIVFGVTTQFASPGAISDASIGAVFDNAADSFDACYEQELAHNPELGGRMSLDVTIATTGAVSSAVVTDDELGSDALVACVRAVLFGLRFPTIKEPGLVVNVPLDFGPHRLGLSDAPRSPADHAAAADLNTRGMTLYRQGKYVRALQRFLESIDSDRSYALGHYNAAATAARLLKTHTLEAHRACELQIDRYAIMESLRESIRLDPKRAARAKVDPDFASVHDTVEFQRLLGVNPETPKGLHTILTRVSWLGEGAHHPVRSIVFRDDGSASVTYMGRQNEPADGRWKLNGTRVQLTLTAPLQFAEGVLDEAYVGERLKRTSFVGRLKRLDWGYLLGFDGLLGDFTDVVSSCGL